MKNLIRHFLFFVILLQGVGLQAATSSWTGGTSDFNNAANWTGGVPTDIGALNTASPTAVALSADATLNGLTFNPGASAYTISVPSADHLTINGTGISNLSSKTQTFNNVGTIAFHNSASAANAVFVTSNAGQLTFNDSSHAGTAVIRTSAGGYVYFANTASADNATIITEAAATPSGSSGQVNFYDSSSGGNATITNNGYMSIYQVNTGGISVGSVSGAGTIYLGSKSLTLGANNTDTTFSGRIYGDGGSLIKTGTGIMTLTGDATYTGDTTINGGTLNLLLGNAIPGNAVVGAAGTLTGIGGMMGLTNNGVVSPGNNGLGTLTVTGYSGSGRLVTTINGLENSSLIVNGNANLTGGTLSVAGPGLSVGRYTAVSASSLTGTFAAFDAPVSPYLSFHPEYTSTEVLVLIDFTNKLSPLAQNGNERNIAGNLDGVRLSSSQDFTNAIGALSVLPSGQARVALHQISGDALATVQSVGLRSAAAFVAQMSDRRRVGSASRADEAMLSVPVQVAYLGDIQNLGSLKTSSPSYGLWSRGVGFVNKTNSDSSLGSPSSHDSTGGFQAGYDFLLSENFFFGISGGYAKTSLTVDDRSASGTTTSLQSGLYAAFTPGLWSFEGAVAYCGLSNNTGRSIQYLGVDERANAKFDSRVLTTLLSAEYAVRRTKSFSLEPTLSLRQSHLQEDGFAETGAPGLNLTVDDKTVNSLVSSLGMRLHREFMRTSKHPLTGGARLSWEHELGDVNNSLSAHFAETTGGGTFTTQATPRSRNAAAVGLDGRVTLTQNLQAFLDYSATLGSGQNTQGLFGGLSVKW